MTANDLTTELRRIACQSIPLPGAGETPQRHRRLTEVARQDLTLAKLAEAHWDAVAILAEADRIPAPGALYAVWASQNLKLPLTLTDGRLNGNKQFASGASLVTHALITAGSQLIEIDVPAASTETLTINPSPWATDAFRLTSTAELTFHSFAIPTDALVGPPGWYTTRTGFWPGACGPAACWAGGAAGLIDFACASHRDDPHTSAHLGALHANHWALESLLDAAGRELDLPPASPKAPQALALILRHHVEQLCTDTLRRFARAYGPAPLSMNPEIARRYHELDLYLRQSHAERDLESLGRLTR